MSTFSTCPSCDKKLRTPDGAEGRKLRCPGCQATLIVTEDGLTLAEEAAKPHKGRAAPRDDDYEDEAPRRPRRRSRKRRGAGIPMWVWLAGGGVVAVGLVVLLLVLLLGGGSKFDKIKNGMTEQQVIDIMGKPERLNVHDWRDGSKNIVWHNGRKAYQVTFEGGKVVSKQQADGKPEPGGGMRWDFK